jgi:hypothetical protein
MSVSPRVLSIRLALLGQGVFIDSARSTVEFAFTTLSVDRFEAVDQALCSIVREDWRQTKAVWGSVMH